MISRLDYGREEGIDPALRPECKGIFLVLLGKSKVLLVILANYYREESIFQGQWPITGAKVVSIRSIKDITSGTADTIGVAI